MNETLPSPSLSFQGGEIWGKGFRGEDNRFDLDPRVKPEDDIKKERVGMTGERMSFQGEKSEAGNFAAD